MCGIAGIVHFGQINDAPRRVASMANSIAHRGPDDEGFWSDPDIALGFRRLSIVDLETGAQPMANEDGTVWVVFNGEIYNHRELRQELVAVGHVFRTDHSDTEVLVHGYEQWGDDLPRRLNGMFAFAIWDHRERQFFLARDRLGIKPVHFAEAPGGIVFSSDIRALHVSGLVDAQPDAASIFEYFQQQNVWGGRSMFAGVRTLEAGSWMRLTPRGRETRVFWDVTFQRKELPMAQAAGALRETIDAALHRQIAADVPVMAYLSGGIDSSSIVAGAHRQDPRINAYSCIFDLDGVGDDRIVDEREFARAVAEYLHIRHLELELSSDELSRSLRATVAALEEPRMGMAYVNYKIAQRVASDSKVVLSGCGGDEILAGYVGRYGVMRDRLSVLASPRGGSDKFRSFFGNSRKKNANLVREAMLPLYSYPIASSELASAFTPDFLRAAGDYSVRDGLDALIRACPSQNPWDILMYTDIKTYLHGLLVIEDKLSMAHSLETRVPLLDNEIIDLSLSYDLKLLTDGITGKKVFREAIKDWVPAVIANKPKMGFGPPDASWYRGALQPFVRRVLDPARIAKRGVFQPAFVANAVEEHMDGRANRIAFLWSMLSFEAWCEVSNFFGGDLGASVTKV